MSHLPTPLPCPAHFAAACPAWCTDGAGHDFDTTDASGRTFVRTHHSRTWSSTGTRVEAGVLQATDLDVEVFAVESAASDLGPTVTGTTRIRLIDDATGGALHTNVLTPAEARRLGVALIRAAQVAEEAAL